MYNILSGPPSKNEKNPTTMPPRFRNCINKILLICSRFSEIIWSSMHLVSSWLLCHHIGRLPSLSLVSQPVSFVLSLEPPPTCIRRCSGSFQGNWGSQNIQGEHWFFLLCIHDLEICKTICSWNEWVDTRCWRMCFRQVWPEISGADEGKTDYRWQQLRRYHLKGVQKQLGEIKNVRLIKIIFFKVTRVCSKPNKMSCLSSSDGTMLLK